jgi:hypothetical protein
MTMREIAESQACKEIKNRLTDAPEPIAFLAYALSELTVEQGIWRFYSFTYPEGGSAGWNNGQWRTHWPSISAGTKFFGEDAFGNQLAIADGSLSCSIWSHESGELVPFDLDAADVLESVAGHGLDWIDFYSDGSLAVARGCRHLIDRGHHLHWTNPLFLGGAVDASNITLVERASHLIGHGQLWSQIGDLPPGTEVVPRNR